MAEIVKGREGDAIVIFCEETRSGRLFSLERRYLGNYLTVYSSYIYEEVRKRYNWLKQVS